MKALTVVSAILAGSIAVSAQNSQYLTCWGYGGTSCTIAVGIYRRDPKLAVPPLRSTLN